MGDDFGRRQRVESLAKVLTMRRLLFNILTLSSLLLFTTAMGIWMRSYLVVDNIDYQTRSSIWEIGSERGIIAYYRKAWKNGGHFTNPELGVSYDIASTGLGPPTGRPMSILDGKNDFDRRFGDFDVVYRDDDFTTERLVEFPLWLPAALSLVMPAVWEWMAIRDRRWQRRKRIGQCVKCGYDLRASENRCPECGTSITTPAQES